MINIISLKADFKLILRDWILVILLFVPVVISVVFKIVIIYAVPALNEIMEFDLSKYYGYVLTVAITTIPILLGTVAAFLMIDDRDARIYELISITPSGYMGYITNRLMLPFAGSIIYTFTSYYILNIFFVKFFLLVYIAVLSALQSIMLGLFVFSAADDKVKGLTYSKGMGVLTIVALADLFNIRWFSIFAGFTPFYWITRLINDKGKTYPILMALFIHLLYMALIVHISRKKRIL